MSIVCVSGSPIFPYYVKKAEEMDLGINPTLYVKRHNSRRNYDKSENILRRNTDNINQ
jgi:hypothetical protein